MLDRLPEPDARIEADALLKHAVCDRERHALLEERRDLRRDVVVPRVELHRARLALHVHQADVGVMRSADLSELGVGSERRHVIHHLRAELERAATHLGLSGVDRDGHLTLKRLEDGNNASKLLVHGYAIRSRPSRLTTDVDDRRPLLHHPPSRSSSHTRIEMHPAIRKGVGRDVDHSHHRRPNESFRQRNHRTNSRTELSRKA